MGRNMRIKPIALLLALAMAFTLLPHQAFAALGDQVYVTVRDENTNEQLSGYTLTVTRNYRLGFWPANSKIEVTQDAQGVSSYTTEEDGRWETTTSYDLTVTMDGYETKTVNITDFNTTEWTILLTPTGTGETTEPTQATTPTEATEPTQAPEQTYTVTVRVLDQDTHAHLTGATVTVDSGAQVTELGGGYYSFTAPNGDYGITVSGLQGYKNGAANVTVTDGDTSVAVYVTPIPVEYTVNVTVVDDATGQLLEGATVTVDTGAAVTEAGDGVYTFSGVNGTYEVTVKHDGYLNGHGTANVNGKNTNLEVDLTPEDPNAEYIDFEIFYIATGEFPTDGYATSGEPANYGPSGNDVPLVVIQVDINALKDEKYSGVVSYVTGANGNQWHFVPAGEEGDLDAAIQFWDAVLECTSEDSISAFKATGLYEDFIGYCLKSQGYSGNDYHCDGLLNVKPPVYVIELYMENTYVGGSVTDEHMEPKTIEEVLASLESYVGQNITWDRDENGAPILTNNAYTGTYIIDYTLHHISVTQSNKKEEQHGEIYYAKKTDEYFLAQFNIAIVGSAEKIQYKVTYTDGVSDIIFEDQEFAASGGDTPPAFTNSTAYEGHTFLGWELDSDGQVYTDQQIAAMTLSSDMVFTAVYEEAMKVVFHANNTAYTGEDVFRVYYPEGTHVVSGNSYYLNADNTVDTFYDIPTFAYLPHNDYIFMGWYLADGTAMDWSDTYTQTTHLYAQWIETGSVAQEAADTKIIENSTYRGFDLIGAQIREESVDTDGSYDYDDNGNIVYNKTYSGLRFITALTEDVYEAINALNALNASGAEYGFAVAKTATSQKYAATAGDPSDYNLQYKGSNVNGVNTATAFKYVQNMKCSGVKDHFNGTDYRLYTAVITYDGLEGDALTAAHETPFVARSYIRYYDANGLLRTYYNNYTGTQIYHGCSISYSGVAAELAAVLAEG